MENKPQLVNLIFGGMVVLLLIFAPEGIAGIGRNLRDRLGRPGVMDAALAGAALAVEGLCVSYGRKGMALDNVSLEVPKGGIVALLGANRAGKTTLIRAVTGLLPTHHGRIAHGTVRYEGRVVTGIASRRLARLGMAQVPEGRLIFKQLTVEENLRVGAAALPRREVPQQMEQVFALFPRLLLVDELSLGLAPMIVDTIYDRLMDVGRTLGTAILIVEQNAQLALEFAKTAYVLERGRIVVSGPAAVVAASSAIAESYLGLKESAEA